MVMLAAWLFFFSAFLHGIFWIDTRRKHQQWMWFAQKIKERNTVRSRLRRRRWK